MPSMVVRATLCYYFPYENHLFQSTHKELKYICIYIYIYIYIYTRYLKNQRFKKLQIGIEKNQANKAEDTAMNTLIIQITTARVVS